MVKETNWGIIKAMLPVLTQNCCVVDFTNLIGDGETSALFSVMNYKYAHTLEYSSKTNIIGHLWKDITIKIETMEGIYLCDKFRIRIIKTQDYSIL